MSAAIQASAPGKMVLTGEYAVLHGAPALVMAVNRRASVTLTPASTYRLRAADFLSDEVRFSIDGDGSVLWHEVDDATVARLALVAGVLRNALAGQLHSPFALALDTRAFYLPQHGKLGLGSSAALTACLTAVLHRHCGMVDQTSTDLLRELRASHSSHQQGNGSGVDLAASLCGGVVEYCLRNDKAHIEHRTLPASLTPLCVWSGRPASTHELLTRLARWRQDVPQQWDSHMASLTACALVAAAAIRDAQALLDAVDAYGRAMDALGMAAGLPIFTDAHRRIAAIAHAHGAAYKPSGAGGGDVGVAFSSDTHDSERLRLALGKAGFFCPQLAQDDAGLTVDEIQPA